MILAVPQEHASGERRVAVVPESVKKLVKAGIDVVVQAGAGDAAAFHDDAYTAAGARIEPDVARLFADADFIVKVQPPIDNAAAGLHEATAMKSGAILLTTLAPLVNLDAVRALTAAGVTTFSTDLIPRITRAQKMDTLSSMSTIAGYKAVLLAANATGKLFPMMMTAAGTLRPAGLQAIATARRLGAVVEAFDVRPAAAEQIESLGATSLKVDAATEDAETKGGYAREMSDAFKQKQEQLTHDRCNANDVVITTALIFGKTAPTLITEAMVRSMRPGSVIVDLAAEMGGNCALTEPGATVVKHGVTIIGERNLPATMPFHASQMYSRNITAFVLEFTKDGAFNVDMEDEIIAGAMVTRDGKVVNDLTRNAMETK
ncbi:MAG: NAD(P) transhydrogenase subunit alpha [Phycisphaerae bacterium]